MTKKDRQPRRRNHSRLAEHRADPGARKVLKPPLRQLPVTDARWLQDHVPEYLWAAGFVASDPDAGLLLLGRVLDVVAEAIASHDVPSVDGTLSSLEIVPADRRAVVLVALKDAGLLPVAATQGFAHALRMYPGAPGSWLARGVLLPDDHVDPSAAESYLNRAIATIADGRGPGATAIKALALRQFMIAGEVRFPAEGMPVDELSRYPNAVNAEERGMVESFIRATYLAMSAAIAPGDANSTWSTDFWNANWNLYPCRVRSWPETAPGGPTAAVDDRPSPTEGAGLRDPGDEITALWISFLNAEATTDPHLYEPGRHEVLSGLTAHALRMAFVVASHPSLWVGEFGAPLLRSAAEVVIYLSWFNTPEGRDPDAHQRFKSFGRGRLKLAKLHAEEFSERMGTTAILDEVLEGLGDETNREVDEEWQDISLEANFSGRDLRKMAIAADAEWLYKMVIAPMSSVLHSEWPMLTRYAMELCSTPVHRPHWLPRRELSPAVRPQGGEAAVVLARHALRAYRSSIAPLPETPVS